MSAQALLLSAGIAERLGRLSEASVSAQQALAQLDVLCPPGDEVRSVKQGCDFRSASIALRILGDAQSNRGATVQALTLTKRWLALVQAGNDRFLTVLAKGNLAAISQSLDRPADAQNWLEQAEKLAEGDTLLMAYVKTYEAVVAGAAATRPACCAPSKKAWPWPDKPARCCWRRARRSI